MSFSWRFWLVSSAALAAASAGVSAQPNPNPILRPIITTPRINNLKLIGYIPDRTVALQRIDRRSFQIPPENLRPALNEAELVADNEFVMVTNEPEQKVQLRRTIPLNTIRQWDKMRVAFGEKIFNPEFGSIASEPPAGDNSEDGRIIIRPIPNPRPFPNPQPLSNPEESGFENQDAIAPEMGDFDPNFESDSVIGSDGRTRVNPTTGYPWRAIGLVGDHCSGALIGPRHVLTAAHCVYNIKNNSWYNDLQFTPGMNGAQVPYAAVGWSMAITKKGWTEQHKSDYDWALIVLDTPVGNNVGWFGYGYNYAQTVLNLNISGYPGDKPFGTQWRSYCSNTFVNYLLPKVYHKCDTWPGHSGSPMWVYIAPNYRSIRAIHTNGAAAGYNAPESSFNSASLINSYVFNSVKQWKSDHP